MKTHDYLTEMAALLALSSSEIDKAISLFRDNYKERRRVVFCGLLAVSGDVLDLAARLTRLLADPAERGRLGDAGRERIRRDLRPEDGSHRLQAVLQKATRTQRTV